MGRNWGKLARLLTVAIFMTLSIVAIAGGEAAVPINEASGLDAPLPPSSPPPPDSGLAVPSPNSLGSDPSSSRSVTTEAPANSMATPPGPEAEDSKQEENVAVPNGGWQVDVSIREQKVRIFKDGDLQKQMVCSTGSKEKPTPMGKFNIQNRGLWFFSQKYQQGGKYWVSFKNWGQYLFHSVPMDKNQNILPEEASKLGQPASHGCIRLAIADAKWIYDNIPQGTPVNIHQ